MALVPITDFFAGNSTGSAMTVMNGFRDDRLSSSKGRDNGTINMLTQIMRGGVHLHSNTSEMVHNLADKNGMITICGHGAPGFFETGDGQMGWSYDGHVELYNEDKWKDLMPLLWSPVIGGYDALNHLHRYYRQMQIMACSVAGSNEGMDLLQRIATLTNRQVNAYTGLIYVMYDPSTGRGTNIMYQRGYRHVRVYPNAIPPDHGKITPVLNLPNYKLKMKDLFMQDGMETEDVASIIIAVRKEGAFVETVFPAEVATGVFSVLFNSQPFSKAGGVTGIVTAIITIKYNSQPSLILNVYADAMAESTSNGQSFMLSQDFRKVINELLNL